MLSSDAWTLAGLAVANAVLGLTAVGWNGVYLAEIARALSVEKVGSTTRGVLRSNARAFRRTSSAATGRTSPQSSSRARRSASVSQVCANSSSEGSSRLNSSF